MSCEPPYVLDDPSTLHSAVVFSSPHSGRCYLQSFIQSTCLSLRGLRASEDVLVDQLFAAAPLYGAPLISATMPRAWLDLNRAPDELDPALIQGIPSQGFNPRVAAGLGVVPRVVAERSPIYKGKIQLPEAQARIRRVHEPYHRQLGHLLARARKQFGFAVLFDCHSMPPEALERTSSLYEERPQIILGDRFGTSANRAIIAQTQRVFEDAGFVVGRNNPFSGGYITRHYGRPSRNIHAIQIEIDRSLYLDHITLEPNAGFAALRTQIDDVVSGLVKICGSAEVLAAE